MDERCAVYWNGSKVGSHRNGYLAFEFDVTQFVQPGTNELKVFVRDDTDEGNECRGKQTLEPGGMFYHAQSGIWQTVWLETVPEIYLRDLKITPLVAEEAVELKMAFSGEPEDEKEVRIFAGESEEAVTIPLSGEVKAVIPVPEPRLWSPEHPELYSLRIEAGEDVVESYFAMRSFGTGTDAEGTARLTLNGEPYFFNGVLDQGYWPESLMTPPSDEALVYDIEKMKALGFNMLRKHVKIECARWYYHCDRIGMVVWQDMINGGGPVQTLLETYLPTVFPAFGNHLRDDHYKLFAREDEKARRRFERDIARMIKQLKEDPTRPVDHASGWFDQGGGDVRSVHNYFRPLTVKKERRAFVISEYGGINCQIGGHSMNEEVYGYHIAEADQFPQQFEDKMTEIRELEKDGLCGAVYTQVSDIEEETNGLLTYDRKVRKV